MASQSKGETADGGDPDGAKAAAKIGGRWAYSNERGREGNRRKETTLQVALWIIHTLQPSNVTAATHIGILGTAVGGTAVGAGYHPHGCLCFKLAWQHGWPA
jgi:hypothetical protein